MTTSTSTPSANRNLRSLPTEGPRESLIELDLPAPTVPASATGSAPYTTPAPGTAPLAKRQAVRTVAPTMPAPTRTVSPTAGDTVVVSDAARSLAQQEHDLAKEYDLGVTGGVDEGLFFQAGTKLWDIGENALRQYAEQYAALPTLAAAAEQHSAVLAREERKDVIVPLSSYRIDGVGKLRAVTRSPEGVITFGQQATAISANAFTQIQGYYPHDRGMLRSKGTARSTTAAERAQQQRAKWPADKALPAAPGNLNGWLGDLTTTKNGVVTPTTHRLRARTHRGQREVFAVFSSSNRGYTAYDTDKILAEAAKTQPDLRVDVSYDADTTRLRARAIAQAPIDIPAFVGVGRVHQLGFDLRSADDGSMSIQVRPFLIRVRCKNASLVETEGKRKAFRHVGSFRSLEESMRTALEQASAAIKPMRDLWARAAAEHYLDTESGASLSVEEAIERLIANEYLPTGGLDAAEAKANYLAAWRAEESPSSAMGIIMAVQRAAHEGSWASKWAEDEIEEAGSALLYQHVYTLDAPEEEAAEA